MEKKEKKHRKKHTEEQTIKTKEKQLLNDNSKLLQLEIIKKLKTLSKQLINKKIREYSNSKLGAIFNEHEITAIAEDLVLDIATKVVENTVDEKGMYNYFRSSFKNKCIDLKNSHCHTIKRGSEVTIENNNLHDIQMDGSDIDNPENILYLKNEFSAIHIILEKFDTEKTPYSKIIKLLLEDYKSEEIQKILSMKASTLDRSKKKAFHILNNYFKDKGISYLDFIPENVKASMIEKPEFFQPKEYSLLKDISYNIKNLPENLIKNSTKRTLLAYIQVFVVEKEYQDGKNISNKFLVDSFQAENQAEVDNYISQINNNSHLYIEKFTRQKNAA